MGMVTWSYGTTEESEAWLMAVEAEEAGKHDSAAALYLNDAASNLHSGFLVKGALSCSCAAECLMMSGFVEEARRLFFEAGAIFAETAEKRLSSSIRESLWALQRAYECFVLAEDVKYAEVVEDAFKVLAQRVNPVITGAKEFRLASAGASPKKAHTKPQSKSPSVEVREATDALLQLRLSAKISVPKLGRAEKREIRKEADDQESVISQIG